MLERERELEAANQSLEKFAYVMSKELREQMKTISNFMRLLQKHYAPELDERGQQEIKL